MTAPQTQLNGNGARADGDGTPRIREITQAALRTVVADRQRGYRRSAAIADGLRGACDAARASGLHAEQLLVIVKDCWHQLPDTQVLDHAASADMLTDVVGMCIRQFYRQESQP
jgi:hypothetical protein